MTDPDLNHEQNRPAVAAPGQLGHIEARVDQRGGFSGFTHWPAF